MNGSNAYLNTSESRKTRSDLDDEMAKLNSLTITTEKSPEKI